MPLTIRPAPASLKASVWKHFGFHEVEGKRDLDKTHAVCKLCETKIRYFGGSTTNMRNHVSRFHPEVQEKEKQPVQVWGSFLCYPVIQNMLKSCVTITTEMLLHAHFSVLFLVFFIIMRNMLEVLPRKSHKNWYRIFYIFVWELWYKFTVQQKVCICLRDIAQ